MSTESVGTKWDLSGRVALVTGSTRGIGRAIAIALAAQGADLVVHGRGHSANLIDAEREIAAMGRRVVTIAADLASEAEAARLARDAAGALGPIDILVNNAAIATPTPIEQLTLEQWHAHLAVNLTAAFVLTQAVLPGMRERRWGRIINLSSTSVQNGGTTFHRWPRSPDEKAWRNDM